jgi:hypothetical protein
MQWAWSSEPAFKDAAFFRVRGNVVAVPDKVLAAEPLIGRGWTGAPVAAAVWFSRVRDDTPIREMKIHAEQYGKVLSPLGLPRVLDVWPSTEEDE